MKIRVICLAGLVCLMAVGVFAKSPFRIQNRLRLEIDSNVYQSEDNETESFKILDEIEILYNLNIDNIYLGLRYRPNFVWYEERDNDSTDIIHDLDVNFSWTITPRLVLGLSETLRAGQLPELQDGNMIVRENDDYYYNTANATLAYTVRPGTRLDLSGRYALIRYDSDSPAKDDADYDNYVVGLSLRQQFVERTTGMFDFRYQRFEYCDVAEEARDRSADVYYAGLGVEQNFSPNLLGSLRGGLESRSYKHGDYDDQNSPYADASITYLPSSDTRVTVGASYLIQDSDPVAYLSAGRASLSLSVVHDLTAKMSLYLSGRYTHVDYEGDFSLGERYEDADEDIYQCSARVSYEILKNNWLEAYWQFVDLDTDVVGRASYTRHRAGLGWRIELF